MSRIVVHDYTGHPFQIQLSRELARRGHDGASYLLRRLPDTQAILAKRPDDPATLEIVPITLGRPFAKQTDLKRRFQELNYAEARDLRVRTAQAGRCDFCRTPPTEATVVHPAAHAGSGSSVRVLDAGHLQPRRRAGCSRSEAASSGPSSAGAIGRSRRRRSRRARPPSIISPDFEAVLTGWASNAVGSRTIPNWAPLGEITARRKDNAWARAHGLADRRCFVYSREPWASSTSRIFSASLPRPVCPLPVVVVSEGIGADWLAAEGWVRTREPCPPSFPAVSRHVRCSSGPQTF